MCGRLKVPRGKNQYVTKCYTRPQSSSGIFGATEATGTGYEIRNLEYQILLYNRFPAKQTREFVKLGFLAVQEVKWEKSATEQIQECAAFYGNPNGNSHLVMDPFLT